MKYKKIISMLLAGSILMSGINIFAAETDFIEDNTQNEISTSEISTDIDFEYENEDFDDVTDTADIIYENVIESDNVDDTAEEDIGEELIQAPSFELIDDQEISLMSVTGQNVVDYAYDTWKGTPWKNYTCEYAPGVGVDCSALMQFAYSHFGYSIPRTTYQQRYCGININHSGLKYNHDYSSLQPGDLIFFNNYEHVGMYAGNGYFVHTSYSRGVVKQVLYGDGYNWNQYACEVRRIITSESVHTHNWSYGNDSGHPHKQYRTCSCGAKEYTGAYQQIASCSSCYPLGNINLTRSFNRTGKIATIYRNDVVNANSYMLTLYKNGVVYDTYNMSSTEYYLSNLPSGTYYATLTAKNTNTGQTKNQSCNSFQIVNTYTITYNANGGTNAPSSQIKIQDENMTITSSIPTKVGHVFKGWSTSKTAAEATYQPGGIYSKNTKATLYAVWEPEIYTINFNANGGRGELENVTIAYGNSMKMPNSITKESYYLRGWSKNKNTSTVDYRLGIDYNMTENTTLYAVWGNSTWSGDVASKFSGGDGTKENPYQISNASELAYLANIVNSQNTAPEYKYYKLTDNINLGYTEWVPIGLLGNENQYFCGSFDGNGYTISDLSITNPNENYIGLFGCVQDGEIKNLKVAGDITSITTNGTSYIGSIAGQIENTNITNCGLIYVNISDISSSDNSNIYIGGISGNSKESSISACSAIETYIGMNAGRFYTGIITGATTGDIDNCKVNSTAGLFSTSDKTVSCIIGGIAGNSQNVEKCTVKAAYFASNLTNATSIGGIVGSTNGDVKLCTADFNDGINKSIDGTEYKSTIYTSSDNELKIGGIVGTCKKTAKIENCKYNGNSIAGTSTADTKIGGIVGFMPGDRPRYNSLTIYGAQNISAADLELREGFRAKWYKDIDFSKEYEFGEVSSSDIMLCPKWEKDENYIWNGESSEPELNKATNTYLITNAKELAWISDVSNGIIKSGNNYPSTPTFKGYTIELCDDIYLNETANGVKEENMTNIWTPISSNSSQMFEGTFDGKDYSIVGIRLNSSGGLFGYSKGVIQNLSVKRGLVTNCENVGMISMYNYGEILNCYNFVEVQYKNNITNVAGISAYNEGTINNSSNGSQNLYGMERAGGIAVYNTGTISECWYQVAIVKPSQSFSGINAPVAGGIVSRNNTNGKIEYCAGSGPVEHYGGGSVSLGGIAGENYSSITKCYFISGVYTSNIQKGEIGGVAGYNRGSISYCYTDPRIVFMEYDGGIVGYNAGPINYCYTTIGLLYGYNSSTVSNSSYYVDATKLSNMPGLSSSEWEVNVDINKGRPYLKKLKERHSSYNIYYASDLDSFTTVNKCFVNMSGIVFGKSDKNSYVGGIVGDTEGKQGVYEGKIPWAATTNLIAISDKVSSNATSSSYGSYAGKITGNYAESSSNFKNVYVNDEMSISSVNTASSSNAQTNSLGTTRTLPQLKRESFLNTVFGPDTYQSLDYLKENPDAVWVIKDGELPELYYNILNDITLSNVENGKIEVDKTQAVDGEVVTVNAVPNEGYELNKIYVNGKEIVGNAFEVDGNCDIYATFIEKTPEFNVKVNSTDNVTVSLSNADTSSVETFDNKNNNEITAKDGNEIVVTTNTDDNYNVDAIYVNGEDIASNSFILNADSIVTLEVSNIDTNIPAVTYDATNIKGNSATVGGRVDDNTEGVERYIRYWKTSEPETVYTTEVQAGGGEYTITLTDLDLYEEYQYQMTETGEIKSFVPEYYNNEEGNSPEEPEEPIETITTTTYSVLENSYEFNIESSVELKSGTIIVALYDENEIMLSCSSIECNGNNSYTMDMPKKENVVCAKIFIWDSIKNQKPLGKFEILSLTK